MKFGIFLKNLFTKHLLLKFFAAVFAVAVAIIVNLI